MKISNLSKESIAVINKFLKKNEFPHFDAKYIKALKDDVLRVCFIHDEIGIRGTIYKATGEETCNNYNLILLNHGLECADALMCDENFKPLQVIERFNFINHEIEGM